MRIEPSDRGRLVELCDFFRSVHALARIEDDALTVQMAGTPAAADARQLHAYLETWLAPSAARGRPVTAKIRDE